MCGFVSFFAYRPDAPPIDRAALLRVSQAMAKRGPDGSGDWISADRRAGLAHRRLAILDLSPSGAQPMQSADGRLAISYNGEIYNFRALRAELEARGVRFTSHSDTEVLLHLYRQEGVEMLKRLRGMYAFALWDAEKRSLLLARDPFGIKPLYVADDGRTLKAASQVKALLADGGVDASPEPAGHAGFFLLGHVPEPFTLHRGIRALPPGSWMLAEEGKAPVLHRWFQPGEEMAAAEGRITREGLRDLLMASVEAHLVADVKVGVFLSAGLDSATLASLAAEKAGGRIDTLTLGFSEFAGTPKDEVPLAELMAARLKSSHTTKRVTAQDFAANRERLLADMDQPSIDGVNTWFVAKAAAESGLKVALSGVGGDEMFAGYDTFRDVPALAARLSWAGGFPWLGRLARAATAPWIGRLVSPKAAGLLELGPTLAGAWLLKRGLFMPWELPGLIGRDMAEEGLKSLAPLERLEAAMSGLKAPRDRMAALELGWYMGDQLLRDTDWAGMAHGVEIRTPLVDIELFRALIPFAHVKRDMAMTAKPPLPADILDRPKTGFFVPVADWMAGAGEQGRGLRGWARTVYRNFAAQQAI
jgi:asparagine synthase (glutamine-hydrolysing)